VRGQLRAAPRAYALVGEAPADVLQRTDRYAEHLEEGSVLVLYTDGLVERRERDLDGGLEALRQYFSVGGEQPWPHLCDAVLDEFPRGGDSDDDRTLLALHLPSRHGA
jgi:serine phosphatase RsbU (regulator of sigma subunit)